MSNTLRHWMRPIWRATLRAVTAGALAGCVVVPYGPRWHPCYYCR